MGGRLFVRGSAGGSCVQRRSTADVTEVPLWNTYADERLWHVPPGIVNTSGQENAVKAGNARKKYALNTFDFLLLFTAAQKVRIADGAELQRVVTERF